MVNSPTAPTLTSCFAFISTSRHERCANSRPGEDRGSAPEFRLQAHQRCAERSEVHTPVHKGERRMNSATSHCGVACHPGGKLLNILSTACSVASAFDVALFDRVSLAA